MKNIIAFLLRGVSAFAKLGLVIYLGAASDPGLIGDYGLLVTLTVIFSQLAGLEIHQIVVRELHRLSEAELIKLLSQQTVAIIGAYVLLLTGFTWFYQQWLGIYWLLAGIILILDHYTTELYRYNVAKLEVVRATSLLALKNVGWVICLVVLDMIELYPVSIHSILIAWLIFLIIAIFVGTPNFQIPRYIFRSIINRDFILGSIKLIWMARYFMISAAAIAMIGALDKFFIDLKFSKEELGQYFYTYAIASIPSLIVSFTVGLTIWPQCIKLRGKERLLEYREKWCQLVLIYIFIILALSLILYFGTAAIESRLSDSFDRDLFGLLLLACGAITLIEPLKLRLYLESMDIKLASLNFVHLAVVFFFILFSLRWSELNALVIGLLLAHLIAMLGFYLKRPNSFEAVDAKEI